MNLTPGRLQTEAGALAYWTLGHGKAPWCVISHGGALDHRDLLPLAERLAGAWRVLIWDLPGHGESQPRPDPFTAHGCAEALAALMDHLEIERAVHLGFSFGGVVAQHLARLRPNLVGGFIAYACFTPFLLPSLLPPEQVDIVVEASFGRMNWAAIKADFAARCCLTDVGRRTVVAAMEACGREGFLAMAKALLTAGDYAPDFRIEGPVATLVGDEDSNGAPLTAALEALAKAHPGSRSVVVPEAGHCVHLDRPGAFLKAALELMSGLVPAR